ncbi:Ig-like domain-containing protein, partial [Agrococcus sp. 1P02AA]|uniref:Ig-like domain-containing protein n=1 Tax=Agrococcus sp. 1P02AA TaxID=3132259 RepID=UPI0039A704A2
MPRNPQPAATPRRLRDRLLAGLAATALATVGIHLGAAPASALPGESSRADAAFLDAGALGLDLAGIDGAQAEYVDGVTSGASDVDDAALDVTALSALTLGLPDLEIGVGELLQLGVIQQYAEAQPGGASSSSASTADLDIDLLALLPTTPALSTGTVSLGAVGSEAALAEDGTLSRTTTVADATLELESPLVGDLTSTVTAATASVNAAVNGLSDALEGAIDGVVGDLLNLVGGVTGLTSTTTSVTVDSRLDEAVAGLLTQTLSTELVSIDLSTGVITVDLAGGVDLNDLDPNSTLLSPEVLQLVSADVAELLAELQADVNDVLANATDYVDVTIDSDTAVTAPIVGTVLATLTIDFDGTLGALVDGSAPLDIDGTGLLALIPVDAASDLLLGVITPAVDLALTSVLETAGATVDTAVTTLTDGLATALAALAGAAAINLNVQDAGDGLADAATVTAVQLLVLGGTVGIDVATSSVGPNAQLDFAPTIAAIDAATGASTTISGDGWPAETSVSLQVTDAAGDAVGGPITVVTDGSGAIPADTTYPIDADAAGGTATITGTALDADGSPTAVTASGLFEISDTTAPDAPVIVSPADGSTIADATPTVTGTGEPGATVEVLIDGAVVGTAEVDEAGDWSLETTDELAEGEHIVDATQTDAAGNTSAADSNAFVVDTTAPEAPVIVSPADGSTIADATPTVSGTGEPGATVEVSIDGAVVGTAVVDEDGAWSLETTEVLADGEHTVDATQTDAAGNVSVADSNTFVVDTVAPVAPVITGPVDGSTISDASPTVTGTGEPGATVEVSIDGAVVGTAVVDEDGAWSLETTEVLADGEHTVDATQSDAAGNVSPADSVSFTVDSAAPVAPVIEQPLSGSTTGDSTPTVAGSGEAGSTVVVTSSEGLVLGEALVDEDGAWSFASVELADGTYTITAVQSDAVGNESATSNSVIFTVDTVAPEAPVIVSPADGSTIADATPTVSGTGEPGAIVEVSIDGAVVGTAEVDEDGAWSLETTDELADGEHTVDATQTDAAGNTSAADSNAFVVDTTAPEAPVIVSPADGSTSADTTPTVTGTGEPGAIVVVSIDGTVVGTAEVDQAGDWSLETTEELADGEHTIDATQTDDAGNTSPADSVTFVVDTTAPDAPVIEAPADGSTTNDTTPTVSGTGEPGATVEVSIDGAVVGPTEVDEDGAWSLETTEELAEGEHTVDATQTDAAGNTSAADSNAFVVDTTAPAAPVIESPADGSTIGDTTPTVSGTGEPGATVEVSIDGTAVGTAEVDEAGDWSIETTDELAEGEHTVDATQTDAAGNTSPADSVTFTIDTTAPEAPVIVSPADGSTTSDTTPTVSGTGEPGATVEVSIDGAVVGTAEVDEDGAWSLETTDELAEGEHTVDATQTDAAGNTSAADSNAFVVDTTAPDAPVIEAPADGSTTNDTTPTVSGTAEPGATVEVSIDGG